MAHEAWVNFQAPTDLDEAQEEWLRRWHEGVEPKEYTCGLAGTPHLKRHRTSLPRIQLKNTPYAELGTPCLKCFYNLPWSLKEQGSSIWARWKSGSLELPPDVLEGQGRDDGASDDRQAA